MKSERLTVLVTREEKHALAATAKQRRLSIGELVRTAVARAIQTTGDAAGDETSPSAEQLAAIERVADAAQVSLQRAAAALDRAEVELARTRAHFAAKPGQVRDGDITPRALLERGLAKAREAIP